MASVKTTVLIVLGVNMIFAFFMDHNVYSRRTNSSQSVKLQDFMAKVELKIEEAQIIQEIIKKQEIEEDQKQQSSSYRFDNPAVAYYLLEKLDMFEVVPEEMIPGANYSSRKTGFKINYDYCQQHRAYLVNHPELVFEKKNIITNYWPHHNVRLKVLPAFGSININPEVYSGSPYTRQQEYDMRVDTNVFFMFDIFFLERQVGKQYSCLTQASNRLPGHETIVQKDHAGQALVDYAKRYKSKPNCFNFDKYFPKTWILKQKDQCIEFFEEFNSPRYQVLKKERKIVYFRKIGGDIHEGKGVAPVADQEEAKIRSLYQNGTLCGEIKDNYLMQYNIYNPLLVHNRKFGFRIFLLVASANPIIAYYHDGYARISPNEYDPQSNDIKTFVTNVGLDAKTKDGKKLTEEERPCWLLEDFHQYLLENNRVTDPNWLDNYLRPEFKKMMIHLIRMAQDGLIQKSSVYELLGVDFIIDQDLHVWFIEANTKALLQGFSEGATKLVNQMLVNSFEIIFALLRSRTKRVIEYINNLTKEVATYGMYIPNLEQKRQEFKQIIKNRFEPEFQLNPENTFDLIVDENYSGMKRYANFILEECL